MLLLIRGLLASPGLTQVLPAPRLEWIEPAPFDADIAERLFTAYDTGRYADFDRLAGTLAASVVNPFDFEAEAQRWMEAATDPRRRAFVAAAVALELASVSVAFGREALGPLPLRLTADQMRFVLAELGCAWLRDHPPSPAEQAWHEAFVALARATGADHHVIAMEDRALGLIELGRISGPLASAAVSNRARDEQQQAAAWRSAHQTLMTGLPQTLQP